MVEVPSYEEGVGVDGGPYEGRLDGWRKVRACPEKEGSCVPSVASGKAETCVPLVASGKAERGLMEKNGAFWGTPN